MFRGRGSAGPSHPRSQDKEHEKNAVLHQMLDLFLDSVDVEVIQTVLESCEYNREMSKEALKSISLGKTQNGTQPLRQPRYSKHQRIQHANPKSAASVIESARINEAQSRCRQSPSQFQIQSPNRCVNHVDETLERIQQYIKNGHKILVLMRGCPGSGKSHLANQLLEWCGGERSNHVFSTDDYFQRNGRYVFNPRELQSAHKSNQDNALRAVRNGYSPVVVDNTNTQLREMQAYVIMAVSHGYALETLEPQTPWAFNHAQLVRRNVHGVPPDVIRVMLGRYELGLKGEDLIKKLNLNYPRSKYPPQPANQRRITSQAAAPSAKQLNVDTQTSDLTNAQGETNKLVAPPKSKIDSLDQRQRWTLADGCNIQKDKMQKKSTSSNAAQNNPVKLNECGVNEACSSSDVVCEQETKDVSQKRLFVPCSKQDSSSNTNYQDFLLISNNSPTNEIPPGVRILKAISRNINENVVNYVPPIPKKIVVDVSSMTDDDCGEVVKGSPSELLRMFPHVSIGNLETLLETCHGDVTWASNCLLDTDAGVRLDIPSVSGSESASPEVRAAPDIPTVDNALRLQVELNSNHVLQTKSKRNARNRPTKKRCRSQNSTDFKPAVTLPIRRCSSLPTCMVSSQVSGPRNVTPAPPSQKVVSPPEIPKKECSLYPHLRRDSETKLAEGSDDSETSSQDEDEMLEFVISSEFSQQLFSRFGGPQNKFRKSGLSPVLRIPESIAYQIHYYLVLSQQKYYAEDNEEEEELTSNTQSKIDQQLYEEMCAQKPLTKQEEEDMKLATAIYKLDLARTDSPDTAATVLTRKLLQDAFPSFDPKLLAELMEVHGNSFHKTKEMIQEHCMNSFTLNHKDFPALSESQTKPSVRSRSDIPDRVNLRARTDGELHIARIYKQKAKEQSAKREWSAAAVYSQMAKVHKNQHNRNVELTVARVLACNMEPFYPSSLDLHCLAVDAALLRLDNFLDQHILSLGDQASTAKSLYVITGRGKHSSGGIPKIRPAVVQRLSERSMESNFENPGLLRVEITGRSQLSYKR